MKETARQVLGLLARGLKIAARALCLYLDDLFLVSSGVCFVRAALDLGGRPAALVTAGVCLTAYAVVVARSRGGGRR